MRRGYMPCAEISMTKSFVMCWIQVLREGLGSSFRAFLPASRREKAWVLKSWARKFTYWEVVVGARMTLMKSTSWTEAASLSIARCYFACEVLDGKIYAIGGLSSSLSDPKLWDTYDRHTDSWKSHSDPNPIPEIEDSVVV